MTPGVRHALRASAVACAVVTGLLWSVAVLFRPDRFSDDARQHMFWLYRYADPSLFPNDPAAAYFSSTAVSPWGYRSVYALLAAHLDALLAAKLVALALLLVALWLAWLLGVAVARRAAPDDVERASLTGLFCVVATAVLLPLVDLLPNVGFQRTWSLPLTLLCLWALVARRYLGVGVSWLIASLTYPVLIPVLGLTATLVFGWEWMRERKLPAWWHANAALGLAAIAIASVGSKVPAGFGPSVTGAQAKAMPEFSPAGRQNLGLHDGLSAVFTSDRTGLGWSPWLLAVVVVLACLAVFLGSRASVPKPVSAPVWTMALVGVGLWLVARFTLFTLYLPNRHTRYSLGAFAIVVFGVAICALVQPLLKRFGERRQRVIVAVALVAPLAVAGALLPTAAHEFTSVPDADKEAAYAFLRQLPRDSVIAAHPDAANSIPLRTRRSVLASTEESVAFQQGYHDLMKPRIEAELRASYAAEWDEVEAALAPFDVDVFVVVPDMWDWGTYYSPYAGMTSKLYARAAAHQFALKEPPADRVLFRSGDVYVVRVGDAA